MPKSKSKRRKAAKAAQAGQSGQSGSAGARRGRFGRLTPVRIGLFIVLAGLAVWAIVDYVGERQGTESFQALALRGAGALGRVERLPNEGRNHVEDGTVVGYRTDPPVSGTHSRRWADPGVYRNRQPPERLVHSVEHGMIVIYYDRPAAAVMDRLEAWASLFGSPWSGVVLTPREGLGQDIILTAWRRRLRMTAFDAAGAAAFIDAYRGRGPEHRVR